MNMIKNWKKNIPTELQLCKQWVCHDSNKIPLQPSGAPAKTNDPTTWSTFDQVVQAVASDATGRIQGIGFVFTEKDPYVGIDLDKCIIDGDMIPSAQKIIDTCNSYTERSISGDGVHILVKASLPKDATNKVDMKDCGFKAIEIYDRLRYFTMTGDVIEGRQSIQEMDVTTLQLPTSNSPGTVSWGSKRTFEDERIIRALEEDKQTGAIFRALYRYGDTTSVNGDQSRADLKLIGLIARHCGFKKTQIDRLFRNSKLYRGKWDQRHSSDGLTYGELTIQKVLKGRDIYHNDEIEDFLEYHYRFRFNEILGRTEVHHQNDWVLLDDYRLNSLMRELKNKGASLHMHTLKGLLHSDFVQKYHPFLEYFAELPEWDGFDYIRQLADTVQTGDQDYWQWCLKKWLVAMVASALEKEVVNQTVLTLQGAQGKGKSTWLLRLIPPLLKDYRYSGEFNPTNKDTLIHLCEKMLCNLDELDSLTKYKEAAMKEIITKSVISIRRPYAYFAENMTRHASLTGSVNDTAFLHDTTGSRRFLVHRVQSIDYQHTVDMDGVFGQAYHLYKDGFQYWFDVDDAKKVQDHNRSFEISTPQEEMLLEAYEPVSPTAPEANKHSTTELLKKLAGGDYPKVSHGDTIKLGKALSKHGFENTRIGGLTYWYVKRKNRWTPF